MSIEDKTEQQKTEIVAKKEEEQQLENKDSNNEKDAFDELGLNMDKSQDVSLDKGINNNNNMDEEDEDDEDSKNSKILRELNEIEEQEGTNIDESTKQYSQKKIINKKIKKSNNKQVKTEEGADDDEDDDEEDDDDEDSQIDEEQSKKNKINIKQEDQSQDVTKNYTNGQETGALSQGGAIPGVMVNQPGQDRPRKRYSVITQEVREKFIERVLSRQVTIKAAAKEFGIKFSTSKAILQTFKREGRTCKKKTRQRTTATRLAGMGQDGMMYDEQGNLTLNVQGNSMHMISSGNIQAIKEKNEEQLKKTQQFAAPQPQIVMAQQNGQIQGNIMQKLRIKRGLTINTNLNINKNMRIKFPTQTVEEMFPNPFDTQKPTLSLKTGKKPISSIQQRYKDRIFNISYFEKQLKDINVETLKKFNEKADKEYQIQQEKLEKQKQLEQSQNMNNSVKQEDDNLNSNGQLLTYQQHLQQKAQQQTLIHTEFNYNKYYSEL